MREQSGEREYTAAYHTPPTSVLSDVSNFINRDLSWLAFNRRVLDLAMDQGVPLLERVRFLMISASNLDEFFMKRMALLRRRFAANLDLRSSDGMTVRERLERCREAIDAMFRVQAECWTQRLLPELINERIPIEAYKDLPESERRSLDAWYDTNVFPIMTPLAVDPGLVRISVGIENAQDLMNDLKGALNLL